MAMSERAAAERVARFLRLNYVPGTTDDPWDQQDPDERDAWLIEAAHVVDLVHGAHDEPRSWWRMFWTAMAGRG